MTVKFSPGAARFLAQWSASSERIHQMETDLRRHGYTQVADEWIAPSLTTEFPQHPPRQEPTP